MGNTKRFLNSLFVILTITVCFSVPALGATAEDAKYSMFASRDVEEDMKIMRQRAAEFNKANYKLVYGLNLTTWDSNDICFQDKTGKNIIGWNNSNEEWQYFDASGLMKRGTWIEDGGKSYYLDLRGKMLTYTNVDGYYLGADGSVQGKAMFGRPTYTGIYVKDKSGKATKLLIDDFKSKVSSGEIKVRVSHNRNKEGDLEYYLI